MTPRRATPVYRRDRRLIDVFVWPGDDPAADGSVQGYNFVSWRQDRMTFRAVSDLNAAELATFAGLWRGPG